VTLARASGSSRSRAAGTAAAAGAPAAPKPGRGLADQLAKLGIARDQDLVLHMPLRYEDHTRVLPLADLRAGVTAQTEGTVIHADVQFRPRRQLVCCIEDGAAEPGGRAQLFLRFFQFYPNQHKALQPGARVRVFGEVREGHHGREIVHPQFKLVDPDTPLADALTPVYPTTAGLSQETLRKAIARALAADPALTAESLPEPLLRRQHLWKIGDALRFLHAPPPRLNRLTQHALDERVHPAWVRLKFDELVAQQLSLKAHRRARAARHAPVLTGTGAMTGALLARVPFSLTRAQQHVWREISHDLKRSMPMQRLLQGDVGSGKTVVAALAALQAIESGRQVALMAPTEILAEQHYRKLAQWLEGSAVRIAWLAGGMGAKARKASLAAIASGEAAFAIGTHALFEDEVELPRLGLAIIDEQHRFGVAQRLKLRGKALGEAHQLMMSATPIPRTLAMTFYADLDVSVLDELPPGRTPVATRLVNNKRRGEIIERVRRACAEGRQAYWVCPLIEESEKLELQTAVALHQELTAALAGVAVGLLHGRMKPDAKAKVMAAFAAAEVQVLVATTCPRHR
jgi:ATP-dependent DNA helicase RecG